MIQFHSICSLQMTIWHTENPEFCIIQHQIDGKSSLQCTMNDLEWFRALYTQQWSQAQVHTGNSWKNIIWNFPRQQMISTTSREFIKHKNGIFTNFWVWSTWFRRVRVVKKHVKNSVFSCICALWSYRKISKKIQRNLKIFRSLFSRPKVSTLS